jgi:hypothetical protein
MEFAPGKPIPNLVWSHTNAKNLLAACDLAGKILAQIQTPWTRQICLMPVETLAEDLAAAPWHLSYREQKILDLTLKSLSRARTAIGQVYYDYKAANLLFDNGELFLVDPPDRVREGPHLWDFACFRSSMRRNLWRFSLQRPLDRRRALITQAMAAFERSYHASLSERHPEPALFAAAARIFELQRTAVLMTMQQGKVDLVRQRRPIARNGSLGNPIANRLTLVWLELEKRWLFRRLARELP